MILWKLKCTHHQHVLNRWVHLRAVFFSPEGFNSPASSRAGNMIITGAVNYECATVFPTQIMNV
jgi:hypothetical protein